MDGVFLEFGLRNRCVSFVVSDDQEEDEETCYSVEDKGIQTDGPLEDVQPMEFESPSKLITQHQRTVEESLKALKLSADLVTDEEVLNLIDARKIEARQLEKVLGDACRGVHVRRQLLSRLSSSNVSEALNSIPHRNYDFSRVVGVCCENVIGYVPLPVGFAGPLIVDGETFFLPMATTEGCLVASTNRGCSAVALNGGVRTQLVADGMSRGPVVRLPDIRRAAQVMAWLDNPTHVKLMKEN